MINLQPSDIIASLAFATGLTSLVWNIVKDFILDRTNIDFSLAVGEFKNVTGQSSAIFIDVGATDYPTLAPQLLISIINTGRRHIYLFRIGGEYTHSQPEGKNQFSMVSGNLPKKLEPFEIFSSVVPIPKNFSEQIPNGDIKNIWVEDTTGKKWKLKKKGWERLNGTMDSYLKQSK